MNYQLRLVTTSTQGGVVVLKDISTHGTGQLSMSQIYWELDSAYFKYVEGPPGLPYYPAVVGVLESKAPPTKQVYTRRAGSNASGSSDLWILVPSNRWEEVLPAYWDWKFGEVRDYLSGAAQIERRSGDFMAFIYGDRRRWECARTPGEALERLVQSHPEELAHLVK